MSSEITCRWPYALVDGIRRHISEISEPTHGICLVCGEELVARIGKIREHHWAHAGGKVCDAWYQPKGPWHLYWQNKFPKEWQEVVIEKDGEKHIADVRTCSGAVVEAQWSPITAEEISERENFYKNMLWIVGMNRVETDWRIESRIKLDSFSVKIDGVSIRKFPMTKLNVGQLKWFNCSRPVFLDFGTAPDRLGATDDLYYVMPGKENEAYRFCAKVPRDTLIEALRGGRETTRDLFQHLKNVRIEYERLEDNERKLAQKIEEKIQHERDAKAAKRQLEDRNKEYEKALPYLNDASSVDHAIAFANQKFHCPPRHALTLGWVDAYLILGGLYKHIRIDPVKINIAPYGRLAIHLTRDYSTADYECDCAKAKSNGVDEEIANYGVLSRYYGDKIVGCVDYLVKYIEGGLALTFANPDLFLKRESKARKCNRSERTFWELPQDTQDYLGNVDPQSKLMRSLW